MSWVLDSDHRLAVERACAGESESVQWLLGHYRPAVFRYCLARLGDVEWAEDVTQEVCVGLVSALPRYQDRGKPFVAFVFGVAANQVATAWRGAARRNRREQLREVLPDAPSTFEGPETRAVRLADVERARALLALLPESQRQVLLLRVAAELSTEETAAVLGMTVGAVRVAQHRALARLRAVSDGGRDA
jgi:RNA polymerase sigma-70 factor, ECF subfamily